MAARKKPAKSSEKKEHLAHEGLGLSVPKKQFSEWYLEVLLKAGVVDQRYPLKGSDVLMPLGAATMHRASDALEELLMDSGHQQTMFPTLIPESLFKKESQHIKGFEEEVYWVERAGKNKLEERLVLRPTSETAMYPMFALWIRSYKDLPLKIFQTVSTFRYETKMTKPLLRMREVMFFIEAHTAHALKEEAEEQVRIGAGIYKKFFTDYLALSALPLRRPDWDKFPGSEYSVAFETVMPDGKILQLGTVHNLGDKFAKVFDVKYLDDKGNRKYVYQTCYGVSARVLAGIVGIHGDDKGLILPPAIAPVQVVVVPIFTEATHSAVMAKCGEVVGRLVEHDFRVHLDSREQYTPGYKFHDWEMKGVPVRIEIGPADLEKRQVIMVRRDFRERIPVPEDKLEEQLLEIMDSITFQLQKRASEGLIVHDAKDYKELKEKLKLGGFVRIPFCNNQGCAEKVKEETGAEIRGTLFDGEKLPEGARCAISGKPATVIAYVGKAY